MAIPSRQIGKNTTTNLLWEISKQLERLICVRSGGCITTTTTTTSSGTNYNVAGCERMEYHVITYTDTNILPLGTIVQNETPECWYIIDQTTNPADVGTVQIVWNTLGNCSPCIDSHTTTTTTTATPDYRFYNVIGYSCNPCNEAGNFTAFVPYATPLTIGSFYNNPENRGYSFLIVDELATSGQYDLTGEPAYDKCDQACTGPTTTTTTTAIPLVHRPDTMINFPEPCAAACDGEYPYYDIWLTDECSQNWPSIGCRIYLDALGTTWLGQGTYNICTACLVIDENGYIIAL